MNRLIVLLTAIFLFNITDAQDYTVFSPDGRITLTVNTDEGVKWSVKLDGKQIILPSSFEMELPGGIIPGDNFKLRDHKINMIDRVIRPVIPHKDSRITERYNELTMIFRKDFELHFRAYNDGVAYRIRTTMKDNMLVLKEKSVINFAGNSTGWYPLETSFMSHNERTYIPFSMDTIGEQHLASLPTLVRSNGVNVLITETALENYPGMWLRGAGNNSLISVFPYYPEEEKLMRDRDLRVVSTMDFIAETKGERNFPWRVFLLSDNDAGLIESNLTYLLSDSCRIDSTDWIKPGKVAWDWWNANNIHGVDFRAGLNNETYKYYIDFASENGIEYVILDEGWYQLGDLLEISPGFDIKELCDYAAGKDVGIILWAVWITLEDLLEPALAQFEEWGVKGIKVDFMQRDDQPVVEYYYKIARKAAEHKLLVDFHGSYKPAGLRRTYPNVITREGVKGLEHNKWSRDVTPEHDVTIPFIRMVAGPMDYTPGAMVNLERGNFNPMFTRPASQGTRVHQMALYIVFESPLQMLADNPSNYRREQECTDFIVKIPVTWDETRVIGAAVGDYVIIARRKGDSWYVGVLTDWNPREFELKLDFLDSGEYNAIIFEDGINADRYAADYRRLEKTISASDVLNIKMAPGGGWAAIIEKRK
ncbi:MAG TPA: glycoside hydrolase family 97 protein [Bacteroidales bacterium]|nr:glycoside hydrolase family 97 protein [Bacteroidales bacterium]